MIPMLIAAGATIAGSAIAAGGQASAQDAANEAAAKEAEKQREWQSIMSNTAVQRYANDLEDAGFNRILAAGGGQASTPSGAVAPVGPVNKSASLGAGLSTAGSTAMNALVVNQEMQKRDAEIAAQKAQTLAAVATANNQNASAKSTELSIPIVEARARSAMSESDARMAESEYRKAQSRWDAKAIEYDNISKRVIEGAGAASDALMMKRLLESFTRKNNRGSMRNPKTGKERPIIFEEIP